MVKKATLTKKAASLMLTCSLMAMTVPSAMAQVQVQSGERINITQETSYMVPAGTVLGVRELSFAQGTGDMFVGQLVSPIRVDGSTLVPEGSLVLGEVMAVDAIGENDREIRLTRAIIPRGNVLAFSAEASAPAPVAVAAVREDPLEGRVMVQDDDGFTIFPRATWGPDFDDSEVGRILGGTVGGAAFGAATGTLSGLTMAAVYDDMDWSVGTGAVRGLAWGSAYGAGLGLLSGLVAAAFADDPVAVTSTQDVVYHEEPLGEVISVRLEEPLRIDL